MVAAGVLYSEMMMSEQVAGRIGKVRLKSNGVVIKVLERPAVARRTIHLAGAKVHIEDYCDLEKDLGVRNDSACYILDMAKHAIMFEDG